MTVTKAELANMLVNKMHGVSKLDAKELVELFFEEIRASLANGEEVKIAGFGNFQLRDKPTRPGRNPKTGEEVPISARRVVTFHASQKLKHMIDPEKFLTAEDFEPKAGARARSGSEASF